MATFKIARPSEHLAITGWGIRDIKLAKKSWVFIGQRCCRLDLTPVNYSFNVEAMSKEKLLFNLPAIYTVGPRADDPEALLRYVRLLGDEKPVDIKGIVLGLIEGKTRMLAASMTMEEIFTETKEFKREVFEKVQLDLDQFGLFIYNANVKQLVDVKGHEYFSYLGQKIQQEAANQAKVDVAKAKQKGDVGAKEQEGMTKRNIAKIEADTKVYSTKRKGDGEKEEIRVKADVKIFENRTEAEVEQANSQLAVKKADWDCQAKLAQVVAAKTVDIRDAELQVEVEKMNAVMQSERLKAELLSKAKVDYDMKVQEANWELYKKQKAAEASLYEQESEAQGRKAMAEATVFASQLKADGDLYAEKKKAEGMIAMAKAEGIYARTLLEALGGNYAAFRDYMMINSGAYLDMARVNAGAINGLQPKLNVWTNGSDGSNSGDGGAFKEIAGVYKMLPPLFGTVQEQTAMQPGAWLVNKLPSKTGTEVVKVD